MEVKQRVSVEKKAYNRRLLSSLQFLLLMDDITKGSKSKGQMLKYWKVGVDYWKWKQIYIQPLTYADNIFLVADTEYNM